MFKCWLMQYYKHVLYVIIYKAIVLRFSFTIKAGIKSQLSWWYILLPGYPIIFFKLTFLFYWATFCSIYVGKNWCMKGKYVRNRNFEYVSIILPYMMEILKLDLSVESNSLLKFSAGTHCFIISTVIVETIGIILDPLIW